MTVGDIPAKTDLRREALLLLDAKGDILETAREVSRALAHLEGRAAIVGGIAVLLNGYVRTTVDVDVYVEGSLARAAEAIRELGFEHDPIRREFVRRSIPVHFVTARQVPDSPKQIVEIEGIRTVSLEDLIAMKLRSGTTNLLRAIDLADVIGLVRANRLSTRFASRLPNDLRDGFRRIARAIADEPPRE